MQKQVYTLVVEFSIQGDLAYLSHQETLKMFQRGLVRASIPLTFSMGFNPHPRLSIPFPRSVGTQSRQDRLCAVIELPEGACERDEILQIQSQLPEGCTILDVQKLEGKCIFYPQGVRYTFHLKSPFDIQFREHLVHCQQQVREKREINIQRYWAKKKRYKMFDISPCLQELSFIDNQIDVVCVVDQSGTVRVDELMPWLNITLEELAQPVSRTEIRWSQN